MVKLHRRWSLVWKYFTISDTQKITASCNFCQLELSFKSTANLTRHINNTHPRAYNDYLKRVKRFKGTPIERIRRKWSILWKYFIRIGDKYARCVICHKTVSYKTTTWNLKNHLHVAHKRVYNKVNKGVHPKRDSEDEDEASKHPELWTYFEREGDGARCVICEATFQEFSSDDLKAHMLASHPKLMEQVARQENHTVGASSEGEEYKEVVYLEAESSPEVETEVKYDTLGTEYPSETQSAFRRKPHRRTPKRQRESVSSDDSPKKRQTSDNDDELESFATYIRCLLKSLPPDVFRKVQLDVVNVILNARSNYSNTGLSSGVNNGFIVLDGKTIPGSVAVSLTEVAKSGGTLPNYNITVTPSTPGSGKSGEH